MNERFVKRYLGGVDPFSQRIHVDETAPGVPMELRIVGVHADVRMAAARSDPYPLISVPFAQSPTPRAAMAVRATGNPAALQRPIAAIVASILPGLPLGDVRPMERVVSDALAPERFHTTLFAWFGAVGLLLAAVATYGVSPSRWRSARARSACGWRSGRSAAGFSVRSCARAR